jgi:hypothetical protein
MLFAFLLAALPKAAAAQAVSSCLNAPTMNYSGTPPTYGVAPAGWSVVNGFPSMVAPTNPSNTGSGGVINFISRPSTSGGAVVHVFGSSSGTYGVIGSNLTGLTVGQRYTVAIEWQRTQVTNAGIIYYMDGDLFIQVGSNSRQTYTSGLGASADDWMIALYTFTATSTSAPIYVGVVVGSGSQISRNPSIVFDAGDVCKLVTFPTDTDGDGINDATDLDDDNDGIPNTIEAATARNNGDTDGDGIIDSRDLDSDNDGILDITESGRTTGGDANGDGRLDGPVGTDGIPDSVQPAPNGGTINYTIVNTDGDTRPDFQDLDSDNDGINDVSEAGSTGAPAVDANGDGVADGPVNPNGVAGSVPGVGLVPPDTDGDSRPDFRDLDSDNDGINDVREGAAPGAPVIDANNDGLADGADPDGDGILAAVDGYAEYGDALHPTAPDTDSDGKPDFRDLDSDNDAINDLIEAGNGAPDTNGDGIVDGNDTDGDGIKDPADGRNGFGDTGDPLLTNSDIDAIPNYRDLNSDNDSLTDLRESGVNPAVDGNNDGRVDDVTDPDNDGIPGPVDGLPGTYGDANNPALPDGNNNGIPDYREVGQPGADTDGDGLPDATDFDDDNDGIMDVTEAATARNAGDTDGDGIIDRLDLDSDNDGLLDLTESGRTSGADANGDGRLDGPVGADGIPDSVQNAPNAYAINYVIANTDRDARPDFQDLDADNDSINDVREANGTDNNGDGLADGASNGNGIPGSVPAAGLISPDTDGDGKRDWRDLDSDNDAINDIRENNGFDANNDGLVDGDDLDNDGILGGNDSNPLYSDGNDAPAPDTDGDGTPDFRDLDTDNDGLTDLRESGVNPAVDGNNDGRVDDVTDPDNDGIPAPVDGLPGAYGDANSPALPDGDNDSIPDFRDTAAASFTSRVWSDLNSNGIQDANDPGVNGIEVRLLTCGRTVLATRTSANGGLVDFPDLNAGCYIIRVVNLTVGISPANQGNDDTLDSDIVQLDSVTPGIINGNTAEITLAAGQNNSTVDIGLAPLQDTDGDGVPNGTDLDDDNDGIPDATEAATARNNGDTDGDGIPDSRDLDSDNDGILDITESGRTTGADANGDGRLDGPVGTDGIPDSVQPTPNGGTINYLVADTDGDSRPDFQDLDSDNDGLNDVREANGTEANGDGLADNPVNANGVPGSVPAAGLVPPDTDGDSRPDFRDLDSDNDAINDVIEGAAGSFPDANGDGIVDGADTDGDGIKDGVDSAPATFGDASDPTPTNSDTDATPDFRDLDSDNDGLTDLRESGVTPAVDANNDGKVDDTTDPDRDGIPAPVDGAPAVYGDANSPTLPNTDGDGIPDYRDPGDNDNDGIPDATDLDDDNDGIPDTTEAATARNNGDTDGDGIADRVDLDSDNDGILDITESGRTTGADANGDGRLDGPVGTDGIPDSVQPTPNGGTINYLVADTDGDSRPDFQDLDSDNDGLNDVREANGTEANGDGLADNPVNANGVPGSVPAAGLVPPDTDGDTRPDFRDLDSDNDAINDVIEGAAGSFPDANGDGIVDGADSDGDGIKDGVDSAPATFGDASDPTPTNSDTDATPDFRDLDSDNDGLTDLRESGVNPAVDVNNDGKVDDTTDPDRDGIPASVDGLPTAFGDANNPTLPDSNGNGTPDYRDPAGAAPTNTPVAPTATPTNTPVGPTPTATNTPVTGGTAIIGDRVWNDVNGNGVQDIGERGVPGVTVQVLAGCTGTTGVVTKLTTNSGDYIIGSLPAGQYRIKVTLPAGFTSFSPKDIILDDDYDSDVNPDGISDCFTLTNGQEKYTLDAGLVSGGVPPTPSPVPTNTPVGPTPTPTNTPGGSGTATIGDRVWNDINGNGVQDIGERGVSGVTVQVLAGCTGATDVVTKLTNNSGDYIIGSLPAGQYRIKVTLPAGFTSFSPKDIILDDDYDSDVNPDGISDCFTLTNGQEKYTLDAGLVSGGVPPTPSPVPTNTPVGPTPTPTNTPVGPTPTPAPTQPGGFICDDGICPDNDGDGIADYLDDDDDNDGIPTIDEDLNGNGNPTDDDSDGDGIPNYLDPLDSDGDTIPDLVEDANNDGNPADDDTDGDGTPDYLDLDSDNDGIPDRTEVGIRPSRPYDADRDRTPNYRDLDSDNDGKPDSSEGTASRDGDGIPDYLDRDDDGPDSGDSDNDGVPDAVECPPAALGAAFQDTDRDGIPDYMDTDTVLHYYLSLIHH